jgi:predicted metal-dependent hydrolase
MKTGQFIDYKIVYSRRSSIGISVNPDSGIVVRAPYRTSRKTIENIVQSKSSWIKKHLESHSSLIRINNNKEYIEGESHYFRGNEFFLRLVDSERSFININADVIEIGLKVKEDKIKIKVLLERWHREMAQELFREKLNDIIQRFKDHNFSPAGFNVRVMKGRWGSCNSKGKITLSTDLVKLKEIYLEYVILHELCHLKHHNHSPEFYRLLSEVFPQWKSVRKELRRYIR